LLALTVAVGNGGDVVTGAAVTGGAAGGAVTIGGNVEVVVLDDVVVDVVLEVLVDVDVDVVVGGGGGLVVVVCAVLAGFLFTGVALVWLPTVENPVTSVSTHASASARRPTDVPAATRLRLRDRARSC
jgi:hypothetical protein